jgi:hypothetical protein
VWNEYAREKIAQLDEELRAHLPPRLPAAPRRRRPLAPIAKAAGRRVRRFGEALESWAAPVAEPRAR